MADPATEAIARGVCPECGDVLDSGGSTCRACQAGTRG